MVIILDYDFSNQFFESGLMIDRNLNKKQALLRKLLIFHIAIKYLGSRLFFLVG